MKASRLSVLTMLLLAAIAGSRDGHAAERPIALHREGGAPLRDWMVANATPAISRGDFVALARVFAKVSAMAPEGAAFVSWAPISRAGEAAAKASDLDGARRACRDCHVSMRTVYKKSLHDRPLPK